MRYFRCYPDTQMLATEAAKPISSKAKGHIVSKVQDKMEQLQCYGWDVEIKVCYGTNKDGSPYCCNVHIGTRRGKGRRRHTPRIVGHKNCKRLSRTEPSAINVSLQVFKKDDRDCICTFHLHRMNTST